VVSIFDFRSLDFARDKFSIERLRRALAVAVTFQIENLKSKIEHHSNPPPAFWP